MRWNWEHGGLTLSDCNSSSAQDCADLVCEGAGGCASGDKSRWGEVDEAMYTIGSNNGRLEDIRDGYAQLGQLYQRSVAAGQPAVLAGE